MNNSVIKILLRIGSYVLVAALAVGATLALCQPPAQQPSNQNSLETNPGEATPEQSGRFTKLEELAVLIDEKYIDQQDYALMEDMAAYAFVDALPDQWSYYVSADAYNDFSDDRANQYVGIGITIVQREDNTGFDIVLVEPDSPAQQAGILPGDILVGAEGQNCAQIGMDETRNIVRGEEGTDVTVDIKRGEETLTFTITRKAIQVKAATGKMLEGNIGYVLIANFHENACNQTIEATEALIEQGATAMIYDVRNNGGGFKSELVALLDYLLPEGPLFRSMDYNNNEVVDYSKEDCLEIPMVVMVNGNSYSAAEFFAAALDEYDWATVVGDPTSGKGYFQNTYQLSDGSAIVLSVGKYFTPNGISLADEGGIVPEILVEVDDQTAAMIYAGALEPADDPQLVAAMEALK